MPYEARGKCVYKKGAKKNAKPVGCTTGDVNDYLAALAINVKSEQKELDESLVTIGRKKMFDGIVAIKDSIKDNAVNTSDAFKTIVKAVKTGENLTKEQRKKMGDDLKTLLKSLGYGAVFMLPGGTVFLLTVSLIRKIMEKRKLKNLNESNKLKGGKADNMSPKDIADKFGVTTKMVKDQIKKGKKIESEHTDDEEKQTEIAEDHVSEFPDYYNRIEKMEKEAKKYWGKKEKTNESKSLVKKLLRENLENQQVQQQIQAELQRLGLPSDTQVYMAGEPITCSKEKVGELNEGFKEALRNVVVVCSLAAGAVSCNKADTEIMYKYVYDDAGSLEYSKQNSQNIRNTCLVPYDHVLKPAEIKAEQDRLAAKYANDSYKKITVMNDTLVPLNAPTPQSPDINYTK
jgi:hypothetical protein